MQKLKVDMVKHVPIKEISGCVIEAKFEVKKLEKLMFIEVCYLGLTMDDAIEATVTSPASGY